MNYSESIVESSARIATLGEQGDLATRIPSCPDWTVGDLVFHLGGVHRFWAAAVRERNPEERPNVSDVDVDDSVLVSWAREQTVALVDALAASGGAPCWTWWGEPRTADAVARHQVQEAVVHCWDICKAMVQDFEIPVDEALDGIAEFLEVQSSSMEMPSNHFLSFQAMESADVYTCGDPSLAPVALSGTACDIVLVLYKRRPLETLKVNGDIVVAQRWLDSIDLS